MKKAIQPDSIRHMAPQKVTVAIKITSICRCTCGLTYLDMVEVEFEQSFNKIHFGATFDSFFPFLSGAEMDHSNHEKSDYDEVIGIGPSVSVGFGVTMVEQLRLLLK